MEYGRGVVLRIDAGEGRIAQDGGAQAIFGMQIRAANALIHDFLQAPVAFPAAILPPLHEDGDDAGVLTDWSVSPGAHAAVGTNWGDGVLRTRAFLLFIGFYAGPEFFHRA